FIHGAGDVGWYWHLVEAELRMKSHDTVAPDLPCDNDAAGLSEYADTVAAAIGDRTNLIVVAQSAGGFTAPLVCQRAPVHLMVLAPPMIPAPGEAPADYWANPRYGEETREQSAPHRAGTSRHQPGRDGRRHTPALSRPAELAERLDAYSLSART